METGLLRCPGTSTDCTSADIKKAWHEQMQVAASRTASAIHRLYGKKRRRAPASLTRPIRHWLFLRHARNAT